MPKALRFRGKHALKVVRADNPSNIIWENQDISRYVWSEVDVPLPT